MKVGRALTRCWYRLLGIGEPDWDLDVDIALWEADAAFAAELGVRLVRRECRIYDGSHGTVYERVT